MLAKLFYDCYNINASNDQMTLNILFNTNLADNILTFIRNNMMFAKINEFSGGALGEINSFNDITAKLKDYENSINEIYKKIDAKKKELEDATVGKAKAAATDAANKATEKAKDAAKSKLKNLF